MAKRLNTKPRLSFTPILRARRDLRQNFAAALKASWKFVQIETPHTITFKLTKRRS